jgi:hypothetical protein
MPGPNSEQQLTRHFLDPFCFCHSSLRVPSGTGSDVEEQPGGSEVGAAIRVVNMFPDCGL